MVQELSRPAKVKDVFPATAPAANPVFYRTYSRKVGSLQPGNGPQDSRLKLRETWDMVCDRITAGLAKLGSYTPQETALIRRMQRELKSLPSGRWLWVGGTEWIEQQENFSGAYNCTSTNVVDWKAFGLMMDLAMMGCGTGAILEPQYISQLPSIRNQLSVTLKSQIGTTPAEQRRQFTEVQIEGNDVYIWVGDSRQGWVKSYQTILELSSDDRFTGPVQVTVDLSDVRPAGETLKGFGGVANPIKLPELYGRCVAILNPAIGRQLTSVECCLLIDEAAVCIVAGNIRRCLPEDALVHTSQGLVPIQAVQVGDLVQTPLGFRRVVTKFDQGLQDVYEVETNGTLPRATLNHRMAVLADGQGNFVWKQVQELAVGDRLLHNTQALPGTVTHLPPASHSQSSSADETLTIPVLTADVAWLIGYTQGQGSVALGCAQDHQPSGQVAWTMAGSDPETTRLWQQKLDRVLAQFGVTATHGLGDSEHPAKSVCSSLPFVAYVQQYIQPLHPPLTVPAFILQGSVDIRAAYLAGLRDSHRDSQGVAAPQPPQILTTVQGTFAHQVGALLSSLGMAGRLTLGRPQIDHWQAYYTLSLPAFKGQYNTLIAPHSLQGPLPQGLTMEGFTLPGAFLRQSYTYTEMQNMGIQGSRQGEANYERYIAEANRNLPIPVTVQGIGSYTSIQTYDIEVEEAHCFYCDGYLTHNSAGMRQFLAEDELGATAKDNLWQQDEHGNWRIDPDRDALRMANHTRVFHQKPTEQECLDAVRKQFYSGEGAIQYAPEAIARANGDLLTTPELKSRFLQAYNNGKGKQWLSESYPLLSNQELEHRLGRYGLNPCVTADTWVLTEHGPRQVQDLIGQQHGTYINGELFSTTPAGFFLSGVKPVVQLQTQEGYTLRLTANHRLLKVTSQTQKAQYTEWVEAGVLQPGDAILIHNHREIQPWPGNGTWEEGWLLGTFIRTPVSDSPSPQREGEPALLPSPRGEGLGVRVLERPAFLSSHPSQDIADVLKLASFYGLAGQPQQITPEVEQGSYEFYQGFLRGIFDGNGNVQANQGQGVSVGLAQSDRSTLEAVQRMLLRLGIASRIDQNRHELVISKDNLLTFQALIGFQDPSKAASLATHLAGYQLQLNRERFRVTVAAIVPDGTEPVYDCTVPGPARFDANGFVAHNCGEILGANFHCVSGETLLISKDGLHPIKEVVGQTIEIWNGESWSAVTPFVTGRDRSLYRVQFGDGTYLDVTEHHRFFVADRFSTSYKELTTAELREALATHPYALHTEPFAIIHDSGEYVDPTWAYTLGQLVGDGSLCQSNGKPQLQLRLYGEKTYRELTLAGRTSGKARYYTENPQLPCLLYTGFHQDFDPEMVRSLKYSAPALEALARWSRDSILHFVAGLADADGSAVPSGEIRLYLSEYDRAYRIYLLLLKCGIRSSINLVQTAGTVTNFGERKQDLWYLQITDCAAIPCQRLDTRRGHKPTAKGKWQVIRSITELPGLHDTYCFNEPVHHKGVFGGTLTGQCNLAEVHLNQIDPKNLQDQEDAFTAGALSVASLLNHRFEEPRYQYSREQDPIVGVSFTGLFDFFVHAFGVDWLRWWEAGRPDTPQGLEWRHQEATYLRRWRDVVHQVVGDYCDRHQIKRPNRCTTVQPAGTKSLLTGASPGWHPPKAQRFIRRITFRKNDPVALACIDYGYHVIPSQSDKDEQGNLLNDPFDPRCTEWLVEIPVKVSWADLPGADEIAIESFSALTQFDFYMNVQRHWTTHNTSATIELREGEVEALGQRIYQTIQNDEGYISAALLARFDDHQSFPRLPFEPIDRATYERQVAEVQARQRIDDFYQAMSRYDLGEMAESGPAGCDSDKCLFPSQP